MKDTALPDYENPPLVETVLGVQFEKLAGFKNAHMGAFWKMLGSNNWPTVIDAPLLPVQLESFTDSARWAKVMQFMVTQDPTFRMQTTNKDGDRMIQLQNGRLLVNWQKKEGDKYPRFNTVRKDFDVVLGHFIQFMKAEALGDFRPNQWEVMYLNHIPKGTVWQTPKDWGFFLPVQPVPKVEGIIDGESFAGTWQFIIPEKKGRLYIQWQYASKADQEVIVLTLTARGPLPGDANSETILAALDLGRATIVQSFRKLMSEPANIYWGLKNASN